MTGLEVGMDMSVHVAGVRVWVAVRSCLALALPLLITAACGGDAEVRVHTAGGERLSAVPIELGAKSQIVGVDDMLFVTNGRQAAALDLDSGDWKELPPLPAIARPVLAALGGKVLALGLDCNAGCDDLSARGGVLIAGLDLHEPGAWSLRQTGLAPREIETFSVADAGTYAGDRVFYVNHDLLVVDSNLGSQIVSEPAARPWLICGTGNSIESLVVSSTGANGPLVSRLGPTVGADGNATIASLAGGPEQGVRAGWEVSSGGDTSKLTGVEGPSGQPGGVLAPTMICGSGGPILATDKQTFVWSGDAWQMYDAAPPAPLTAAVVRPDGVVAGPAGPGTVALFSGGKWRAVLVGKWERSPTGGPQAAAQPFLAAVGEELVALTLPMTAGGEGKLELVQGS